MNRAKREGKMGIIFSFESMDMLDGKLERIELFRNPGIRPWSRTHRSPVELLSTRQLNRAV
jgi:membrane dipeptidase